MNIPVSFEIAKLLKEKGFDELCGEHYSFGSGDKENPKTGQTFIGGFINELGLQRKYKNSELSKWKLPYGEFSAPTITEVVMWLYEKHGVWVSINPTHTDELWGYEILVKSNDPYKGWFNEISGYTFNSPTEAYEAGIEYALNNLI